MTAIVCVGERGGILFLGRRVSRDIEVSRDIAKDFQRVCMASYSLPLFSEVDVEAVASDGDDFRDTNVPYFFESDKINELRQSFTKLIIYNWNRRYPYDTRLDFSPADEGFSLASTSELVGNSHKKITKEVYVR